jgi:hypothetical protein
MKNHIGSLACSLVVAAIVSAPAHAQQQNNNDNINPWLHCGLGALIFQNNGTAAAISNIIWDLGTTAVTSSAVSPSTCSGNRMQAAIFIQQTYPQLAVETAKGKGEHLIALVELLGCEQKTHEGFLQKVRLSMRNDVAQPDYAALSSTQKAEKYFYAVEQLARGEFSAQCKAA